MRVLALTRYERLGSSSRVRFYQYLPFLKAHGLEIIHSPFFTDEYVKRLYTGQAVSKQDVIQAYIKRLFVLAGSGAYDLLWIEKELFPWLPAWFEGLLSLLKVPYVVDYDDAVYHRYDLHPSSIIRRLLGRKIDQVMRHAALVIVGNEYLTERARQAGAGNVEILPSVVDVDSYKIKEAVTGPVFRIGWIGSPVTAPYLEGVVEALTELSREMDIHVTLIGSGENPPFKNIPTTLHSWNEGMERSIGEMFDVGIMPLVDGPFERGKCGYKLVQYMAAGLPVVASPVGVNRQMVLAGTTGYLAETPAQWLEAFRKLGNDTDLRLKMGQSGRQQAEQLYNLQRTAPRLLDLLSSVRSV